MKRYRLTESKLRNIVREAIINEIGDTDTGQERLGALQARYTKQGKGWAPSWVADDAREAAARKTEKEGGSYNAKMRNMVNAYRYGKEQYEKNDKSVQESKLRKIIHESVKQVLKESELHEIIREAVESALSAEGYSNTEDNLSALADYLDCDASEIEQTSNICFQTSDGQEWYVFNSLEDAEDYVMVDYDAPRFMEDCWRDGQEFYDWLMANPRAAAYYDLKKVFPRMNNVESFDDYDEETDEYVEREFDLSDYPELFTNEVDWEYVAEVVLKYDGPQWFLAGYDGQEVELWNGAVAYRYN